MAMQLDDLGEKTNLALYNFWNEARGQKCFPAQKDLALWDMPTLVPHLFIMDVLPEGEFRYRFVGTEIDHHQSHSITGLLLSEFRSDETFENLRKLFGTSAEQGVIGYYRSQMKSETKEYVLYERLVLPIADDGVKVNKLLGARFAHPGRVTFDQFADFDEAAEQNEEGFLQMEFFDRDGRSMDALNGSVRSQGTGARPAEAAVLEALPIV